MIFAARYYYSIFQSTSSARRTTQNGHRGICRRYDFNPRPPRGGRLSSISCQSSRTGISIHVLREEDDLRHLRVVGAVLKFQSTSSARRTTAILVHLRPIYNISIHVLREEDDVLYIVLQKCDIIFQSTSSARRTTGIPLNSPTAPQISIHVLREEDDTNGATVYRYFDLFQSTSSARRTTVFERGLFKFKLFQSTSSARRTT